MLNLSVESVFPGVAMRVSSELIKGVTALAGVLALALPGAAMAQTQAPGQPGSQIVLGGGAPLPAAEAEDLAVYDTAMGAFQQRGFAGLNAHLPKLRRAMDRAPASYPMVEQVGDTWIVRSNDLGDGLLLAMTATMAAQKSSPDARVNVSTQANVYPMIALLLGSAAVERHDYREAITWLDRGLALQPLERLVLTERIAALHGLQRWDEALKAADAALASGDLLIATHPASLHRKRGFSLVELGRLDEAQAAYEESLKTEPDNAAALGELEYIRGLRRGAAPTPGQLVAPGASPAGG